MRLWKSGAVFVALLLTACASGSAFLVKSSEPHGRVILSDESRVSEFYPVVIDEINGKRITPRRGSINLAPGTYTLGGVAAVPIPVTRTVISNRTRSDGEPLTVEIKEGHTYFVGLDAKSTRTSEWKMVVWKLETDIEEP